ncbi:hypothetical protein OC861_006039, partial [Tilletia horrida]
MDTIISFGEFSFRVPRSPQQSAAPAAHPASEITEALEQLPLANAALPASDSGDTRPHEEGEETNSQEIDLCLDEVEPPSSGPATQELPKPKRKSSHRLRAGQTPPVFGGPEWYRIELARFRRDADAIAA